MNSLLEKEKAGHEDYHFARDLFEGERETERKNNRVGSSSGSKKIKSSVSEKEKEKDKSKIIGSEREEGQRSLQGFFKKKQ